jgi:hypothetical protein
MSDDLETVTAAIHELADRQAAREVLALTFGGELAITITEHDGDYRLHVHVEGGQFSIALSALDVLGLRSMTGDLVMARARKESAG